MRIYEYPSPALKERAQDVVPTDEHGLDDLANHMVRVMLDAPGVGLAATQIGVPKRMIVFLSEDSERPQVVLNPTIVDCSVETVLEEEGCLSLPGITVEVERPARVVCEGISLTGDPVSVDAEDLLARILQHEIDHLDGILIIDRATPEERVAALRRYREFIEG